MLQLHYPEVTAGIYIINTPTIFNMLWRVVKPWLHPKTQSYITLIGTSVAQQHAAFAAAGIDIHSLPHWAGGKFDAADCALHQFGLQVCTACSV